MNTLESIVGTARRTRPGIVLSESDDPRVAQAAALAAAVLLALVAPSEWAAHLCLVAVFATGWGVLTERLLFFAEAEHVSQLYYNAKRA